MIAKNLLRAMRLMLDLVGDAGVDVEKEGIASERILKKEPNQAVKTSLRTEAMRPSETRKFLLGRKPLVHW